MIGAAAPAPTEDELIAQCGEELLKTQRAEMSDENDPDRVWILRQIHKNYLYYRALQMFAPSIYQGLLEATAIGGTPDDTGDDYSWYDYLQNDYLGYCRKLVAVLGTRMPNVTAMPNNPDDIEAANSTRAANAAALMIRHKCELQMLTIMLVFGLFNFGTMFWHMDFVADEDKNGTKPVPQAPDPNQPPEQMALGNAAHVCPNCGATLPVPDPANPTPPTTCPQCGAPMGPQNYQPPTMVNKPAAQQTKMVPKGALEITLHAGDEVSVPLESTSVNNENCPWLERKRERHKSILLRKYRKPDGTNPLRDMAGSSEGSDDYTVASQYAESIRSAMASPVGIVRAKRSNMWTECDTWWKPSMYEMVDDAPTRQLLYENFPLGLRWTSVRGKLVAMKAEALAEHWQECKPEPSMRIMGAPLGDDWIDEQDISTNVLNQCMETVERSNEPCYYDATRIDGDAIEQRRDRPAEMIGVVRPAGGKVSDIVYRPEPIKFSDQSLGFRQAIEDKSKVNSGITDPIFAGGDADEPTARQAELKKNAALMQLGVPWKYIGNSLEHVNQKSCKILADNEDGVLEFAQKNQFGRFSKVAVIVDDLKHGKYHFEADEAIPMTWGQLRDLLMWMLDKPAELLQQWGFNDPLNIMTFKTLLGMPGERTPYLDERDAGMDTIEQLLNGKPQPGPPDPQTGLPGPPQASIQPKWEEDHAFLVTLTKAYLRVNTTLETDNPDGYQNVQLWGQAQEQAANQPPPPPPIKGSLAVSLKGPDLGTPAVTDALKKIGMIDQGVQVQSLADQQAAARTSIGLDPYPIPEKQPKAMPPPGAASGPSNGTPQVPSGEIPTQQIGPPQPIQ